MNPTKTCWKSAWRRWKAALPRWPWHRARRPSPTPSRPLPRRATTSSRTALYGGTYNLFAHTLPQFGITTRFADHRDPASFEPLIDDKHQGHVCRKSWATRKAT
jgi:hypothetical protein